ncbi:MAG: peptide chain release factor 1 [Candidatus Methanomethylophilaceae archaeon]|nr:peptide chain release factor 1 [Candidatus Methanomethylophilaceae archaeon]
MLDQCRQMAERCAAVEAELGRPETASDQARYLSLLKEYRTLSPIREGYLNWKAQKEQEEEAVRMLGEENDPEMLALIRDTLEESRENQETILAEIRRRMLPRDEDDDRSVIVEIRSGAGGEEAALFASDLYRMYRMFAEKNGWKTNLVNANETELGGFKEIAFFVEGSGAYAKLKYESGVHRVQRVPETESQGRIQTSTATVAVLPEIEDVEVEIPPQDIKMETCKSSGAGGQHINKTESAVRILHIPTGIVVECQEERSQLKNRDKAMKMLRSKLYAIEKEKRENAVAAERRAQIGTGDRSEKIRTYNFPQRRVTDHRIGLTLYSLEEVLNGSLDGLLQPLEEAEAAERMREQEEGNRV